MKVLIACEFSGRVRDAFGQLGHNATSCDMLPSETPGQHYQGDVCDILGDGWDLMVAHPPCTHLSVAGASSWHRKQHVQQQALDFVQLLMDAPIASICIENPISIISTRIRKPDQIIQPWWFGHGVSKKTCLWLKELPALKPTNIIPGAEQFATHNDWHDWKSGHDRSRTFQGIADAMAWQWGNPL